MTVSDTEGASDCRQEILQRHWNSLNIGKAVNSDSTTVSAHQAEHGGERQARRHLHQFFVSGALDDEPRNAPLLRQRERSRAVERNGSKGGWKLSADMVCIVLRHACQNLSVFPGARRRGRFRVIIPA